MAQTREESTSKRDGKRDEKVPSALSRGSGEQRMLLQVSPHPGAPGALSTSPDGTQRVWYGPAMGAAFSGHSFAPPWLERFLSSLWFPSQCRCPAASWERPGEEALCLPRAAMPEEGKLSCATGGQEEGDPPLGCSTPGLPILAPPLSLSLFDPGRPAHACREQASCVMPRRLSPLSAPRSKQLQSRPSQKHLTATPLPNSSIYPGAVFGTTQTCTIR